jgi:hypothetical protein
MFALLPLLAYDREQLMVAALAALVVAGVVVAAGAWLLLFRERRHAPRAVAEGGEATTGLAPVTGEEKRGNAEP